jgi:hypothetical protein
MHRDLLKKITFFVNYSAIASAGVVAPMKNERPLMAPRQLLRYLRMPRLYLMAKDRVNLFGWLWRFTVTVVILESYGHIAALFQTSP